MLICQEMFLLLTKDNGKKEDWVSNNEAALRATVLADLLLGGHVELGEKKKVNLLRRLTREMDAAEPMRQRPRHRPGRPFIGINPPVHAKELPLSNLATNRILAQTLAAQFRGSPFPHGA